MEVRVMEDILSRNDRIAEDTRSLLKKQGVFALNLMGSPGAGKTTLLEKTLLGLNNELRMAVIEGDLFTTKDADRIEKLGVPVIQINTSGGCHLDAAMVAAEIGRLELSGLDLLIIENVGNLVCPAEFDVGEDTKAVVLSITEGDDKPLKYPLIFKESAVTVLNKLDILPYTNFDLDSARDDIKKLNPSAEVLEVSCMKGIGLDTWYDWLRNQVRMKRGQR